MKIVCTSFGFGGYRKGDEVELLGESETHYKIPNMSRINVDFLFVDKRGWAKVQTEFEKIVEEVARSWASIDGKADSFDACKKDATLEDSIGTYGGYIEDAEELIRRSPILHGIIIAHLAVKRN